MPPPVYGLLERRSDIDRAFMNPKSVHHWNNHRDSKRSRNDEISELPFEKRLSPKKAQEKNWKIPPGAKLVGYNMQLIAGYIPTTYLSNRSQKDDKRRLEPRDSNTSPDIYLKHRPGYDMNMTKNCDINEKSNEMDSMPSEVDVVKNGTNEELRRDESTLHRNFSRRESSFLKKQEDSTGIDGTTNVIAKSVNLNDFLWPIVENELKAEKEKEDESDSAAITSVGLLERNLSNISNTSKAKLNSQDGLDDGPILVFQSTVAADNVGTTSSVDNRSNLKKLQLTILQNTNLSMEDYNEETTRNSTSILEMLQSRDGIEKAEQEIPRFQELQMNYTDGQATVETEISPTIQKIKLDHQIDIDKNRSTTGATKEILESNERERAVHGVKALSDIYVTTLSNLENSTSYPISLPRTKILNIKSSEFNNEDEDNDKAEKNYYNRDLENREKFSDEQKYKINEKLNSDQDSIKLNGNDEYQKSPQDMLESDQNDGRDRWQQQKLIGMKGISEEANRRNKERGNFRDEMSNDNSNDHDNDYDYDDNDPKMIEQKEDEMLQLHDNSEEKQERVDNAPIFSPGQIPTFEEWLSSLPIQAAFPFGMKNQLSANPIHFPFPRPFNDGNRRGRNKQERRRLAMKAPMYDYDSDYQDKSQFHEQRFTLSKNVPYE